MSSIYKEFKPRSNSINNMRNFLSEFGKFSAEFRGNPEQRVRQLLQSGQMTQEQFNDFAQTANELYKLIK